MYSTCENKITVSHDDRKVMKRIIKAYNQGNFFDEFVPCPKHLGTNEYDATVGTTVKKGHGGWVYRNRETWCGLHWGRAEEDGNDGISLHIISPNKIALTIFTVLRPPLGLLDHWVDLGCSVSCASFDEDEWNIQIYRNRVYWQLRDGKGEMPSDIEPSVERLFESFGGDEASKSATYY